MAKDLRHFLKLVKELGPEFYVEADKPLNPILETCYLQQKLAQVNRFPVLYCPQVKGSKLPLVSNLFGSWELQGLALDIHPETMRKKGQMELLHEFRRRVATSRPVQAIPRSDAPVKEVVLLGEDVDLNLLPIPHHAVGDSGRYITVGSMICRDPDTGIPNVGVYRHELQGKNRLGALLGTGQHAAFIGMRYAELGRPMEVALFIGHHPAVSVASNTRGPIDMDELDLAGSLLGEPLQVTSGETVDLPVPAFAEIVIEGVIDAGERVTDGPFAEYTGYYGEAFPCHLIKVTALTMRKDAIFHDLDPAHQEHNLLWVGVGREANMYEVVKRAVPTVQAVHCGTPGLGGHPMMYVSIKKRFEGDGMHAGLAALSADVYCRMVVVVDEEIDVYNEQEVLWAMTTRTRSERSVLVIPGITGSHLDPCAYDEAGSLKNTQGTQGEMVTKIVIDATKPLRLPFAEKITPKKEVWESLKLEDYIKT